MALEEDDAKILSLIQETYVPFLKKLIAFSEKNKKATTDNISKLKTMYTIFTTGSDIEKLETFNANEAKLKNWYDKSQKEEASKGGKSGKRAKRSIVLSDNESSPQGVPEVLPSSLSSKKICTSTNSASTNQNSVSSINAHQLRKRKIESAVVTTPVKAITPIVLAPPQPQAIASTTAPAVLSGNEPIIFTCASCRFQTHEENEFMKHARTDHRTDLSAWCKQCSKCFSNASVLVSHIKERACIKEEMIFKCGVKDCVFETTQGQTFVHHLRHCHRGSPFIFCVHCQQMFTLPHCLILHMQDDCPFKDRNRKNPGSVTASSQAESQPLSPPSRNTLSDTKGNTLSNAVSNLQTQAQVNRPVTPNPPVVSSPSIRTPSGGRGAGRGRGRGRVQYSDSNDSNDPDDPSWQPREMLGEQNLRRSGRWAKKINDVMNSEPTSSGSAAL